MSLHHSLLSNALSDGFTDGVVVDTDGISNDPCDSDWLHGDTDDSHMTQCCEQPKLKWQRHPTMCQSLFDEWCVKCSSAPFHLPCRRSNYSLTEETANILNWVQVKKVLINMWKDFKVTVKAKKCVSLKLVWVNCVMGFSCPRVTLLNNSLIAF